MKTRKVLIQISLVDESHEKTDEEIENEILHELRASSIPWCREVEKVELIEE